MELILHIGTHKTGTSSIQGFCANERRFLEEHGVMYAFPANLSGMSSTPISVAIAKHETDQVAKFFDRILGQAKRTGAQKVLVSDESFFTMNTSSDHSSPFSEAEYWEQEEKLVGNLAKILAPHTVNVKIVCYVRRQPEFIESLYSQRVKEFYSGTIDDFVSDHRYALDYYSLLDIWAKQFGEDAIKVRVFDPTKNVVLDFLDFVLNIKGARDIGASQIRANIRIPADILAFKQQLNCNRKGRYWELYSKYAIREMSRKMRGVSASFLSEQSRSSILDAYSDGNVAICERWLGSKPPELFHIPAPPQSYAGLTPERHQELLDCHRKLMRRPSTLMKIAFRSVLWFAEARLPLVRTALSPLRRYVHRRRALRLKETK